jgi:hypothetical protein
LSLSPYLLTAHTQVGHNVTQNLVVAAMLFFTLKCIGYLRGFESTGWLVTVLIQNIFDVQVRLKNLHMLLRRTIATTCYMHELG